MTAKKKTPEKSDTPWQEHVAAGCGLLIVFLTIALLLYEGIKNGDGLPQIVVKTQTTLSTGEGYILPITVQNVGDKTASGVTILGTLAQDQNTVVETSSVTFDYIPDHASVEGGLYFRHDPGLYRYDVRAEGYQNP